MAAFLERNADRGWTSLSDYHGGYEEPEEGYAGAGARA
jgi:hypothetical protein